MPPGKGSTPEYFLRYVLTQNGLDPDTDVTLDWKSEPSEVLAVLTARAAALPCCLSPMSPLPPPSWERASR